jgi:hypothetical protein
MRIVRWDLRQGKPDSMGIFHLPKQQFYMIYQLIGISGPLVCGEGIDLHGNHILTASWKESNQL